MKVDVIPQVESGRVLRVLQLGSPAGMYGAERWIIALVKHLDRRKIQSTVAVIQDDSSQSAPLCAEAVSLGFATQIFQAKGRFNLAAIGALRKYIIEYRIDILHTHFYKTDIIGYLATRGTSCKIVSTPHGWSRKMDFKLWCYEMADRMVFPLLDGVAPLSEDLYSSLAKMPFLRKRLYFIRNGVDLSEIDEIREIESTLLNGKKEGKIILGYIGQLIPRKGLDNLLKAVSLLQSRNCELYLIGDGPERERLEHIAEEKKIREKVHFLGFQTDRLKFLLGFDVLILPSRLEGIPRCLMEAMAAGVPVVASDIPGCNDLIDDERTGLLFSVEDCEHLAWTLEKILSSPDLRKSLVTKARKHILEAYSATRMAKQYEALYQEILS